MGSTIQSIGAGKHEFCEMRIKGILKYRGSKLGPFPLITDRDRHSHKIGVYCGIIMKEMS
jgi:hypothetical protein